MKAESTRPGGRHAMRERAEAEPDEPVAVPKCPPATAPLMDCALCGALRRGVTLESAVAWLHAAIYED
jgi:hypothetical protein